MGKKEEEFIFILKEYQIQKKYFVVKYYIK